MSEKRKQQAEVTFVEAYAKERKTKAGDTIYVGKTSGGKEIQTKHQDLFNEIRANLNQQVTVQITILPGNKRDDGTWWPDSYWLDKFLTSAPVEVRQSASDSDRDKRIRMSHALNFAVASVGPFGLHSTVLEKIRWQYEVVEVAKWCEAVTEAMVWPVIELSDEPAPVQTDAAPDFTGDDDIPF